MARLGTNIIFAKCGFMKKPPATMEFGGEYNIPVIPCSIEIPGGGGGYGTRVQWGLATPLLQVLVVCIPLCWAKS